MQPLKSNGNKRICHFFRSDFDLCGAGNYATAAQTKQCESKKWARCAVSESIGYLCARSQGPPLKGSRQVMDGGTLLLSSSHLGESSDPRWHGSIGELIMALSGACCQSKQQYFTRKQASQCGSFSMQRDVHTYSSCINSLRCPDTQLYHGTADNYLVIACLSRQLIMNGAQFCKYFLLLLLLLPVLWITLKRTTRTINLIHDNHKLTAPGWDFLGHLAPL